MTYIKDYADKVHELIEKPRNELICKVVTGVSEEYSNIFKQYGDAYMEKCLKIEEFMAKETEYIRRFRQID